MLWAFSIEEIMLRQVFFIFGTLLLDGCTIAPQWLGMSSQQWKVMNKVERQQLHITYRDIQRRQRSPSKIIYNGPNIQVTINRSTAIIPPFLKAYPFKSVKFKMYVGKCRYICLTSLEGTHSVAFRACYDGLTFKLDPNRYDTIKSNGAALLLTYNPLWKRGFTYSSLSSTSCVCLNNVTITIHTISQSVPARHVNYSSG